MTVSKHRLWSRCASEGLGEEKDAWTLKVWTTGAQRHTQMISKGARLVSARAAALRLPVSYSTVKRGRHSLVMPLAPFPRTGSVSQGPHIKGPLG